jgi:hypothetical protein
MTGKSHFWRTLLLNAEHVFEPKISKLYIFAHLNVTQYEDLKEKFGHENVFVHSLRELPGMDFPEHSFVWIDELNSAIVGLTAKEKANLIGALTTLMNETCHHKLLFLVCNLQQVYRSDLFFMLGISQSLALTTLTTESLRVMKSAQLGSELIDRAAPLLQTMRLLGKPQFLLIYHNASAMSAFNHSFIWTYLDLLPHLAIAIGEGKSFASASDFELVTEKHVRFIMASPEAKKALREISTLPEPVKSKTFALVPIKSIELDDVATNVPADIDTLDKRVTDMLCEVCSIQELSAYKKLWYFTKRVDTLDITDDGLVMVCGDHEISLLTFLKECLKQPPPARPFGNATMMKKKKKDPNLTNCIPFVAELLRDTSFPAHLIRNTQLKALALKNCKK